MLYTVTGLGLVAALDPATGDTRWVYDPESYKAGIPNNGGFLQRGLGYWTDGTAERLFVGTADAYLLSVDARTGKPDPAFGSSGSVDLTVGVPRCGSSDEFHRQTPARCRQRRRRRQLDHGPGVRQAGASGDRPCVRRANR